MKIVRPPQAADKLGIGVSTLWARASRDPEFPKPVRISEAVTGWVESELNDYLAAKVREYREKPRKRQGALVAAAKSAASKVARRAARPFSDADREAP